MHARSQWRARRGSLVLLALLMRWVPRFHWPAFAGARRSATVVRPLHGGRAHFRRDRPPRRQPAPGPLREIAQLPEVEDASVVAPTLASPENSGRNYYPFLQSTDGKAGFTLQRVYW